MTPLDPFLEFATDPIRILGLLIALFVIIIIIKIIGSIYDDQQRSKRFLRKESQRLMISDLPKGFGSDHKKHEHERRPKHKETISKPQPSTNKLFYFLVFIAVTSVIVYALVEEGIIDIPTVPVNYEYDVLKNNPMELKDDVTITHIIP